MSTYIATQLPRPKINIDSIVDSEELRLHQIEQSLWKSHRRESVMEQAEKHYQEWECLIQDTPARTLFTIKGPNQTVDIEFRPINGRNGAYSINTHNENGGSFSAVEAIERVQKRYHDMVRAGITEFIHQSIAEWKPTITLQDVLEYVLSTSSLNAHHNDGDDCE